MLSTLNMAHVKRLGSIAFPALGTGGLRYPSPVAAKTMYDVVQKFEESHPNTSLKRIQFVIFPKDEGIYKVFEAEHNPRYYHGIKKQRAQGVFRQMPDNTSAEGILFIAGKSSRDGGARSSVINSKQQTVILTIYSDNDDSLRNAKQRITSAIDEEFRDKQITDPHYDVIKNLSDDQVPIHRSRGGKSGRANHRGRGQHSGINVQEPSNASRGGNSTGPLSGPSAGVAQPHGHHSQSGSGQMSSNPGHKPDGTKQKIYKNK